MTQLETAKKKVRGNMRRYKQLAHNSRWRIVIEDACRDYDAEYPGKAYILREVFMSGKARRHRPSYEIIAQQLYVSVGTVNVWVDEMVQEIMLRAAREGMM